MRALAEVVAAAEVDVAERLEVRDLPGPKAAFCVEVKPRKSSACSGIRSAPGTFAATAICAGERMAAVERAAREPAAEARDVEEPGRPKPGERVVEMRPRVAAQEDRDVVVAREPSARVARERPGARADGGRRRRRPSVARQQAAGLPGTSGSKYGRPQATVIPSPAGVGG